MDTRSGRVKLWDVKLIPSNGGGEIDLLKKFNLQDEQMNYKNGFYDLVLHFASGKKYADHSVFIGN